MKYLYTWNKKLFKVFLSIIYTKALSSYQVSLRLDGIFSCFVNIISDFLFALCITRTGFLFWQRVNMRLVLRLVLLIGDIQIIWLFFSNCFWFLFLHFLAILFGTFLLAMGCRFGLARVGLFRGLEPLLLFPAGFGCVERCVWGWIERDVLVALGLVRIEFGGGSFGEVIWYALTVFSFVFIAVGSFFYSRIKQNEYWKCEIRLNSANKTVTV